MPPVAHEDKALYRLHAFLLHQYHTGAIGEETLDKLKADLAVALEQAEAKGYSAGYSKGHVAGYEYAGEVVNESLQDSHE